MKLEWNYKDDTPRWGGGCWWGWWWWWWCRGWAVVRGVKKQAPNYCSGLLHDYNRAFSNSLQTRWSFEWALKFKVKTNSHMRSSLTLCIQLHNLEVDTISAFIYLKSFLWLHPLPSLFMLSTSHKFHPKSSTTGYNHQKRILQQPQLRYAPRNQSTKSTPSRYNKVPRVSSSADATNNIENTLLAKNRSLFLP